MPTTDQVLGFLRDNWDFIALMVTWGVLAAAWLARKGEWRRKTFMRQVNFSLNDLDGDRLVLRTLLEDDAGKVWLNEHGVRLVLRAAQRTTVEQPFLDLGDADDMGYVLRAVLNVVSERFASVYVSRALGGPARRGVFLFGITCEKYGRIRTQKLRVMVVRPEVLDRLFGAGGTPGMEDRVALSDPRHADRIDTLRIMDRLRRSGDPRERRLIGEVELGTTA